MMIDERKKYMRTRSQKQAKLIGRIITYTILIAAAIVCFLLYG